MAQRAPQPDGAAVFDRRAVRLHRDRAAAGFEARGDFLVREVGERLVSRLDDVKRRFAHVLDLGCHSGQLGLMLRRQAAPELLVQADLSPAMAARAGGPARLACDEEWLPIRAASLDLVVSALSLHWVNDLPGALVQIGHALKPDGLLLAAMLGGDTLFELREAFLQAEAGSEDGVRPHVSPFPDVEALGALLQRTGFALPVVDSDRITVTYGSMHALMHDLRAMGEANAARARARHFARRATFDAAAACYREMFGGKDGRIPATFQILYLTGWRPHESQQQPARRGSGTMRLTEVLRPDRPSAEDAGT